VTTYQGSRDASPAQYLYSQAAHTLKRAKEEEEGRTLECMVAIVLTAFAMEAFLNLLAEQTFVEKYGEKQGTKKWQDLERRLDPQTKLDLVVEMHGFKLDTSAEPFNLLPSLFRYRNALAHGKVWHSGDVVFESKGTPRLDAISALKPPWMKTATVGNAEKHLNAVFLMATTLVGYTGYVRGLSISDTASFVSISPLGDESE
jgi:hypothetical protein